MWLTNNYFDLQASSQVSITVHSRQSLPVDSGSRTLTAHFLIVDSTTSPSLARFAISFDVDLFSKSTFMPEFTVAIVP